MKNLYLIFNVLILVSSAAFAQIIEIDFGKPNSIDPALYGRYMNLCGPAQEFTKSDLKLYQEQFTRLKLVRIWGTSYIQYAASMADEALMVFGQLNQFQKFLQGKISESEYILYIKKKIQETKEKYPFLTYIEPFNELTPKHIKLPKGVKIEEAYYRGYRACCRAVNELNREHSYKKPIKIGGCATMWPQYIKNYIKNFLAYYVKDKDPGKRLDFISVHCYMDDFNKITSFRTDIEKILKEFNIAPVLLIMSEVGWKETGAQK